MTIAELIHRLDQYPTDTRIRRVNPVAAYHGDTYFEPLPAADLEIRSVLLIHSW